MDQWYSSDLAQRDRIHFTRKGYAMLGDLLSNAIFEAVLHFKPAKVMNVAGDKADVQGDKHLYKKHKKSKSDKQDNRKEDERPNFISY